MRVLFFVLLISILGVFNISAQIDPAEQYFKKGLELAENNQHQKAIESFQSSLKFLKNDKKLKSKIQYNIGANLYQLKKYKNAEKSFKQAIKSNKKYVKAIYSLGLTQIELKELDKAAFNFTKVISLDKEHGEAWFDLGMVMLEQKKYGNAKIAFKESIKFKTSRLAEAENNLGVIAAKQGEIEIAISHFQSAFVKSNQKLLLAKDNLDYCNNLKLSNLSKLLAKKEILSKKGSNINER